MHEHLSLSCGTKVLGDDREGAHCLVFVVYRATKVSIWKVQEVDPQVLDPPGGILEQTRQVIGHVHDQGDALRLKPTKVLRISLVAQVQTWCDAAHLK